MSSVIKKCVINIIIFYLVFEEWLEFRQMEIWREGNFQSQSKDDEGM